MKNEQKNDQARNDQNTQQNASNKNLSGNQQNDTRKQKINQSPDNKHPQGNERSNIHVGNDGKIGKAHEQWPKDTSNDISRDDQQKDTQIRNDKTRTGPEVDAPIYDPEKTEKKIPQMNSKK